jgi:hypothetical protein
MPWIWKGVWESTLQNPSATTPSAAEKIAAADSNSATAP